ncbi:MAG: DUF4296 domain-containing protein [Chitinophagaceae bacterium]
MICRAFILLSMVGLSIACGKGDKKNDILPQAKMERVIWDMVQADEFVQAYVLKDSARIDVKAERYRQYEKVFRLHNTSREQFSKSYQYYISNPGKNKVLFDSLAVKASRRMEDTYKGKKVE